MDAVEELLTVAALRGDDQLPHPCDDPILWTARMQEAWDDLREALGEAKRERLEAEQGTHGTRLVDPG